MPAPDPEAGFGFAVAIRRRANRLVLFLSPSPNAGHRSSPSEASCLTASASVSAVRRAISMRCALAGFVVVIVPSPDAPWGPCHGHTVMGFFEGRNGVLHETLR